MTITLSERRILRRIPVLRPLSKRELEDLHERIIYLSYQTGDVIWRTRGPLRFSGYIQSGEILLEHLVKGIPVRTTRLCAGDPLPPRSLQQRRPLVTVIARAVTDVRLGILPEVAKRQGDVAGPDRLWPVFLLLLIVVLAWTDLTRITSGLFYMASNTKEFAAPQDLHSMRLLQAASLVDPGAGFVYNEQGYRWFQQKKLPDAQAAFQQAVDRDPASAPALNNLAIMSFLRGDHVRAAEYLERSLQQDPDSATARFNLGMTLIELDEPAKALREFRETSFIDPIFVSSLLQQANLYYRAGDYANAEQRVRSAIQLDRSRATAHLLLATALYCQNREEEALDSITDTLALEPGNRLATFYRGLILGHLKQYDAALSILQDLLLTSTDAEETDRILVEIDALYRWQAESQAAGH